MARIPDVVAAKGEKTARDIQLMEGVRFEANIVDAVTGKPIPDFVLWSWRDPEVLGKSDAHGKLAITGLLPGKFEFNVGEGESYTIAEVGVEAYKHGSLGRWWSPDAVQAWKRKSIKPGESST